MSQGEQSSADETISEVRFCYWHRPFLKFLSRALFISLYLLSLPLWGIELTWQNFFLAKNLLVFFGTRIFAKLIIDLTVAPLMMAVFQVDTFRDPNEPEWPWKRWNRSRDKVVLSILLFIGETFLFLILFALIFQLAIGERNRNYEIQSILVCYFVSSGLSDLLWALIDKAFFERFRVSEVD